MKQESYKVPSGGHIDRKAILEIMRNEPSRKMRLLALLLALFFGYLGIHRFYVGKIGTGLIQLILTLSWVGLVISVTWSLVDAIYIAAGEFKDKQGQPLTVWAN